ncbi:MAG: DUF3857 domain-containing protein [Bacteroidota bacterium]
MNKFFSAAFAALVACPLLSFSQLSSPEYKRYDWEAEPKPHALSEKEKKENAIVFKDKRMIEYAYNSYGDLIIYVTVHKIVKLNTDKAIELNNKVHISMYSVIDMLDLKARVISGEGKITLVDKKNIKDIENYDNYGPVKLFAFEGVELGSEVEYLYTVKKFAQYFGSEIIQTDNPKKNVEISIISPSNLKFEAKTYNGFVDFSAAKVEDGKRIINAKMDEVPAIKEEKYSGGDANRMRVEYKLSYNEIKGNKRLLTWNDASEAVYQPLILTSKKDISRVKGILKKIKVDKKLSEEEKIRKIEGYIKTHYVIKEYGADEFEEIGYIAKNHIANTRGVLKLFLELFKQLDISYEVVLTSDRFNKKFDGDFDSWVYLNEYLIYFPGIDKFMMPGSMFSRLGFVPSEYTCTDGLFIKGVELGDYVTGVGKIKKIPCVDYKANYDNIEANVKFEEEFTETSLHVKRTFTGYGALGYGQAVYSYLSEEDKKKTVDEIMKFIAEDSKVSNIVVSNTDESSILQKPMIIEGDVKTASLLEKAGDKYLFKIGLVIGPQAELYQEEERKSDAENDFNRGYHRVIVFEIPEGYKVTNLDALVMDVACVDKDGFRSAEFKCSYVVEGNKVTVTIEENYKKIIYPREQFEDFRKVINAAADFNKIVLYLEKK